MLLAGGAHTGGVRSGRLSLSHSRGILSGGSGWSTVLSVIEDLESEVRSYCRAWPSVFTTARGAEMQDTSGRSYIDFFAGAGALNYGHNDPRLLAPLMEYLREGGILHSLDLTTQAKVDFLERFRELILEPRGLDYKVQFPGPTGTNAVEAALKLARKVTGRRTVIGFNNGFHGVTLGSLAVTANPSKRAGAGVPLHDAVSMPFDGGLPDGGDTIAHLGAYISDPGVEQPAAVIVETIQAEGGVVVARDEWLRRLAELCDRTGVLLIVDDIQVGCGRTGPFFSFEPSGITPDIVTLSKSLSGVGQPFALTLMRRELDVWDPGEHNGTFRGNNAAFVTGAAALNYWRDDSLTRQVGTNAVVMRASLDLLRESYPGRFSDVRGRGMIQGIACADAALAGRIVVAAYERGVLVESSGPNDEVIKLLPPLTIPPETLKDGLSRLCDSVDALLASSGPEPASNAGG
jgi:diaminobutyrate-2-oxoglutarate transaminase